MKLIIQIPCFNEEDQLPVTLGQLPREVPGFDTVEWLIIDDGSTDRTIEVAREHGVDHIVRLTHNRGLSSAFQAGLDASLKLGADVIVNTDADNQYEASDIPALVAPIVAREADMVVGDRGVADHPEFSPLKKRLQRAGSWVVGKASSIEVADSTSGFRAYNREAAIQLVVINNFTYTLESLIQAGHNLVAVKYVPVRVNERMRESRLFKSNYAYIRRSAPIILRIYASYKPLRVFGTISIVLFFLSALAWIPFAGSVLFDGDPSGHIQSIIFGAVLFMSAVQVAALGVVADLVSKNRAIGERTLSRVRKLELKIGVDPSHYERG